MVDMVSGEEMASTVDQNTDANENGAEIKNADAEATVAHSASIESTATAPINAESNDNANGRAATKRNAPHQTKSNQPVYGILKSARLASPESVESDKPEESLGNDKPFRDPEHKSSHLRWDEANIFLNEQERPIRMKITEPKTPFQRERPPELDMDFDKEQEADDGTSTVKFIMREADIPDLALGGPEELQAATAIVSTKDGPSVKKEAEKTAEPTQKKDTNDDQQEDEETRHRRFLEWRKQHYKEMGHKALEAMRRRNEQLDSDDDDIEVDNNNNNDASLNGNEINDDNNAETYDNNQKNL